MGETKDEPQPKKHEFLRPWPRTTMWTSFDVAQFVADAGFPHYSPCFRRNAITGKDLEKLNVYDLQRIGINNMSSAMRLMAAIRFEVETMLYNDEEPDVPPNHSYLPSNKCYYNHPQVGAPELCAAEPCLPDRSNPRFLILPYRSQPNPPVMNGVSYYDACTISAKSMDGYTR